MYQRGEPRAERRGEPGAEGSPLNVGRLPFLFSNRPWHMSLLHLQAPEGSESSGGVVENNRWEHIAQLNVEVGWLQSWLEGPTHISDVLFRNNSFVDCTADRGGPVSAQPGSFFSLCGAPSCANVRQVNNTATAVDPGRSPSCEAAVAAWRDALGARVPLVSSATLLPPISFKLGGIESSTLLATWDCGATDKTLANGNRVLNIEWSSPDSFISRICLPVAGSSTRHFFG